MKNTILLIAISSLIIISSVLFLKRVYCLKINKDYSFAVGQIIKIKGRDINEVEYAEFEFLVDKDTFINATMVTYCDIYESQKYLVVYCEKYPESSILLMNYNLEPATELGAEIDYLFHRDSIAIPWEIL